MRCGSCAAHTAQVHVEVGARWEWGKKKTMELSFDISCCGQAVSCKMKLQQPVHQMNALSHLGFLMQMYISHIMDDLNRIDELHELKRQKELVESLHSVARDRCVAAVGPSTLPTVSSGFTGSSVTEISKDSVNLPSEPELPSCKLDLSFLGARDGSVDGSIDSSAAMTGPPTPATMFKLKSFVIPRMKSRLQRKSLTPGVGSGERSPWAETRSEPSNVSAFDWGVGEESWWDGNSKSKASLHLGGS